MTPTTYIATTLPARTDADDNLTRGAAVFAFVMEVGSTLRVDDDMDLEHALTASSYAVRSVDLLDQTRERMQQTRTLIARDLKTRREWAAVVAQLKPAKPAAPPETPQQEMDRLLARVAELMRQTGDTGSGGTKVPRPRGPRPLAPMGTAARP